MNHSKRSLVLFYQMKVSCDLGICTVIVKIVSS